MHTKREQHLSVGSYEWAIKRQDHTNGFKPKTVAIRMAPITFNVPQVREGGFCPLSLAKSLRRERALLLALAEMCVQGVSSRKVAADIRVIFNTQSHE